MNISKFNPKFNKLEGNIYTVEEEIMFVNGVYNGPLAHDNINKKTVNIYTGSRLTGDKITNYFLSTPSETPWKYTIKILANIDKAYLTYETVGDQVESEDINNLQNEIVRTQQEINSYEQSNDEKVNSIDTRVVNIETNKADKDKVFTKEEVLKKFDDLIDGSPGMMDTLNEIAAALGNNPNFSATIINLLSNKVDKVNGETLVISTEWEDVKTEINNAKGTFPNIDERFKSVSSSNSGDVLYSTTNIGNNYSVTIPNLTILTDGYPLRIKFNAASTGSITINPNNQGAINVVDYFGNSVTNVRKDLIANLVYDATNSNFQLLGKGGGGNLVAEDLLFGKTATGNSGLVVGSAPNNGIINITPKAVAQSIPVGYTSGGTVYGDSNLLSENIKANKILFGIQGKSSVVDTADALATSAQLLSGVSAYVNGNKIVGNIANNYGVWQYAQSIQPTSGRLHMYPPKGYYDPAGGSGIYYDDANYIDANIVSGKSIFGLGGTATVSSLGGIQYTEIVVNHVSGTMQDINLPYLPTLLVCGNYVCMPSYSFYIYKLGSTATAAYTLMNNGYGGYVIRIPSTYATGTLVFGLYK